MKKTTFTALFIVLALMFLGSNAFGGTLCLNMPGCNDVKLAYGTGGAPGYYSVTGHEYGCAATERILDGSMRVAGGVAYIQYTINATSSYPSPRIGQWNVQYSISGGSGPTQFAYHYESYHTGTGTAVKVSCPAAFTESTESDVGE